MITVVKKDIHFLIGTPGLLVNKHLLVGRVYTLQIEKKVVIAKMYGTFV